jgi:Ca2+-binding EF-hand superfamily protein
MRAFSFALAIASAEADKLLAKQNLDAAGAAGGVFDGMDGDKDGSLTTQELVKGMAEGGFNDAVIGKVEHGFKKHAGGKVTRQDFQDAVVFLYEHAQEQGVSDAEIMKEIKNFDASKVTTGHVDAAADYAAENFAQKNDRAGAEALLATEVGAAFDMTDANPKDGKVTGPELAKSLKAAGFTADVVKALVDEFNSHPEVGGSATKADVVGYVTDLYHTAADHGISDE